MRKGNFICGFAALLTVMLLGACDDHDTIDSTIQAGQVLCADGRIVTPEMCEAEGAKAVGVVFAPQTDDHPVLVVMLDETPALAFCNALGTEQGTSGSTTAFDGFANTVAMQGVSAGSSEQYETVEVDSQAVQMPTGEWSKGKSALADYAFTSHTYLQSDYIPSVAEMQLLYRSRDRVNAVIRRLGGTPLTTDGKGCWYWTSTEVAANKGNQAWLFSMADGSRQATPKTNSYHARFIMEYNN